MRKFIYQFFEGTPSVQAQNEMNELKAKAEAAGWKYELYDLERLLGEIKDNNLKEALVRMKRYLPIAKFGSACSDFFRFYILQNGGLYCDDDVICTTDEFPDFSQFENGTWTCSEQTKITNLNTCITWCDGPNGKMYSNIMTKLATDRLKAAWLDSFEQCKANAKYLIDNKWSLISFLRTCVRKVLPSVFNKHWYKD